MGCIYISLLRSTLNSTQTLLVLTSLSYWTLTLLVTLQPKKKNIPPLFWISFWFNITIWLLVRNLHLSAFVKEYVDGSISSVIKIYTFSEEITRQHSKIKRKSGKVLTTFETVSRRWGSTRDVVNVDSWRRLVIIFSEAANVRSREPSRSRVFADEPSSSIPFS